jgi:hypothetical protein
MRPNILTIKLHDVSVTGITLAPASNLSNEELIQLIGHEFPNLQGPLKMLFERFVKYFDHVDEHLPSDIKCPACGTNIELDWEITD